MIHTQLRGEATMRLRACIAMAVTTVPLIATTAACSRRIESRTVRFDEQVMYPVLTGCRYEATVRGTVTARTSGALVDPTLMVEAALRCPDRDLVHERRDVAFTGELTRPELEAALERRATITDSASRCVYTPDLTIRGDAIEALSVEYRCDRSG